MKRFLILKEKLIARNQQYYNLETRMSQEEKFKSMLQEVKDIYLFLVEGEPSPDDEIEARENLISIFRNLKENNSNPEYNSDVEQILKSLEDWDTLDLWFSETMIPKDIEKMLKIPEHKSEIKETKLDETTSIDSKPAVERTEIDLTQIVDKVSEQFKGEIDGLKGKIEELKKELEKKDATLANITQKKKVQKITPKRNVKLPPPKIKIPIIKKPTAPPKINNVSKPKEQKSAVKQEPLKKQLTPIPQKSEVEPTKEEIKELAPIPKKTPKIIPEVIEEPESRPLITEKRKITPVIMEKPINASKSKESSERKEKISISMEKPKITPVRVEEIESESDQSSAKDLFNVFASVGEKTADKEKSKSNAQQKISEIEKNEEVQINDTQVSPEEDKASPFIDFHSLDTVNSKIYETSDTEKLPTDKDSLYQELIALEGRRYSLEKDFKELDNSYNKGSISDSEYKNKNKTLKRKLDDITTRINNIRRIISSM